MSGWLDPFRGEQIGWAGRSIWMTLTPLRYQSDQLGGRVILIPAEFVTDLASTPRLPLVWLAVGGRGIRSSVIHDWAYVTGSWIFEGGGRFEAERRLVDAVFWESLLADPISGAGPLRAWEMWAGVRIGGRGVWGRRKARARGLNPEWTRDGWPGEVP